MLSRDDQFYNEESSDGVGLYRKNLDSQSRMDEVE